MSEPDPNMAAIVEYLRQISRMTIFPDDQVNRFTLLAAIAIADAALARVDLMNETTAQPLSR